MNHYSRHLSCRVCLNPLLSEKKMYWLLEEKYPESSANYNLYSKVFKREFNLPFGEPRSDTCKVCDKNYAQLILARSNEERNKIETNASSSRTAYRCKCDHIVCGSAEMKSGTRLRLECRLIMHSLPILV